MVTFLLGIRQAVNRAKLLNTKQWLELRHEAITNGGSTIQPNDYALNGTRDTTRYTDWYKELIGNTAKVLNAQLTISGGSKQTQFLLSSTFIRDDSSISRRFLLSAAEW